MEILISGGFSLISVNGHRAPRSPIQGLQHVHSCAGVTGLARAAQSSHLLIVRAPR